MNDIVWNLDFMSTWKKSLIVWVRMHGNYKGLATLRLSLAFARQMAGTPDDT
jgi:hypothetical protein